MLHSIYYFKVLEVYIMHDTFTVYIMTSYLHNLPIGLLYNLPLNMGLTHDLQVLLAK